MIACFLLSILNITFYLGTRSQLQGRTLYYFVSPHSKPKVKFCYFEDISTIIYDISILFSPATTKQRMVKTTVQPSPSTRAQEYKRRDRTSAVRRTRGVTHSSRILQIPVDVDRIRGKMRVACMPTQNTRERCSNPQTQSRRDSYENPESLM